MPSVQVDFQRLALKEYQAAFRWYARRSRRAAQRFRSAVEEAVQRIKTAPQQWPTFGKGTFRWLRAKGFPYLLYYQILDPSSVRILAVAHAKRRPGYWIRRARP